MNAARKAIGDSGNEQRLIRTFSRKGVRFIGTVHEAARSAGTTVGDGSPKPGFAFLDKPSLVVLPFTNLSPDPSRTISPMA